MSDYRKVGVATGGLEQGDGAHQWVHRLTGHFQIFNIFHKFILQLFDIKICISIILSLFKNYNNF